MIKWYQTLKRAYLLDFQIPDSADQMPIGQAINLRDIDPELIVSQLHAAGVEALYVHAKDNQGNCYYNTRYGHKFTGIASRDLMAEFSAACRKYGMVILYYVQLPRERRGAEEDKYAARQADGSKLEKLDDKPLFPHKQISPVMCLNGPGRDYLINIIRELAEGYDFDGFWLDGYGWYGRANPCYCQVCQAKYYEDTGLELPKGNDKSSRSWVTYLGWRRRQNTVIMHELEATVRRANPHLTVTHNASGVSFWADLEFCAMDDYVSNEYHFGNSYGQLVSKCLRNAALKPGVPFEIEVWRFHAVPEFKISRAYQVRSSIQYFAEMSVILSQGGFVQYYDQIKLDGTLDHRSMIHLTEAFHQVKLREPFLVPGQRKVDYASILWSKETDAFAPGRQSEIHHDELDGFSVALMEQHLTHNLITEKQVLAGDFGEAKVLVLPNVCCLSEKAAVKIADYVRGGGGLVATYRTSMADETGRTRQNFLLSELFGTEYIEPLSYTYSYMQFDEKHELTEGLPLDWPMTAWDLLQLKTQVLGEARGLGHIVNPSRGMHMGNPPQEATPYPALVYREYGQGRVVYIPSPIGAAYHRFGNPDSRQLMANAVRWAAGVQPLVELKAPQAVNMVTWQVADRQWNVHLVNMAGAGSLRAVAPVLTEVIPVYDLEILARMNIEKAVMQPGNQALQVTMENGGTIVRIPQLDSYFIIELTLAREEP